MLDNPLLKALTDFALRMLVFLACLSVLFFAVIGIASVCSSGHEYSPSLGLGRLSSPAAPQPLALDATSSATTVPTPIPTVVRSTAPALTPIQPLPTPPQASTPLLPATPSPPTPQPAAPAVFAGTW